MDHRGRSRYSSSSSSEPRHRSLGRQTIDKLEDAMESLQLTSRGRHGRSAINALEVIPYHAGRHMHHHTRSPSHHRDHSYDGERSRRYHSSSPARHHHHRHPSSHDSYSTGRSRPSSRRDSEYDSHSRSRSHWGHGLQASVEAAAIEAFRLRNEPGTWKGKKAGRVATAALSAGVIGVATEHRRERRESDDYSGKKGALGAAMAGLAVNRLVNGPRREVGYS